MGAYSTLFTHLTLITTHVFGIMSLVNLKVDEARNTGSQVTGNTTFGVIALSNFSPSFHILIRHHTS